MRFWRRRSIIWTVFSTFVGIFAFYILLAVLNALVPPGTGLIRGFVTLLNDNFPYLLVIALILMIGQIFDRFSFPLNLPAPLFHALASVFLVIFFFNFFEFIDSAIGAGIYRNLEILRILLSILIFLIVFTGGYFKIFGDLLRVGRERQLTGEPAGASPDVKTWNDIGNEFRQLVFDILQRMREEIREQDED
ncbi:MAG: hypothetical protein LUO97_03235 [Methanomicrobiales archaeon]|nr:hypothetical protein [Methanomicrobiales archaeon]MDD1668794.1 hypothetical protein [Methanomicrobiales archaeon]